MPLQSIKKSEFKAKALEFFRLVESTGKPIVITDHGKPKVEVRPYVGIESDPFLILKGSVRKFEAPTEPVSDDDWDALS